MNEEAGKQLLQHLELMCCPGCGGDLELAAESLSCVGCGRRFEIADNVPLLFLPNEWSDTREDITESMKAFYEETPFPNYDEFDSVASLVAKARRGRFAKLLDDQIAPGSRVIECGCGTGQLSQYIQLNNNHVLGIDMFLASLGLAVEHKLRNALMRSSFAQMNIFNLALKDGYFDIVISHSVLHHTYDVRRAFEHILKT